LIFLFSAFLTFNQQGKSELEQLKEAFFNFDIDRDGFISCEDMKVFLMTKGAKMSREEVRISFY
jgi:Ca2+-binding EF-hand superfamily protein